MACKIEIRVICHIDWSCLISLEDTLHAQLEICISVSISIILDESVYTCHCYTTRIPLISVWALKTKLYTVGYRLTSPELMAPAFYTSMKMILPSILFKLNSFTLHLKLASFNSIASSATCGSKPWIQVVECVEYMLCYCRIFSCVYAES